MLKCKRAKSDLGPFLDLQIHWCYGTHTHIHCCFIIIREHFIC